MTQLLIDGTLSLPPLPRLPFGPFWSSLLKKLHDENSEGHAFFKQRTEFVYTNMADGEGDGTKVGLGRDHDRRGCGEEDYEPGRVSTNGKAPGLCKEPRLARREQETTCLELHIKKKTKYSGVLTR